MTQQEAKALALEKLCYYANMMPNYFERKHDYLPREIRDKTEHFHNKCPLCELFCIPNPENGKYCGECPLTPPSCNDVSDEALEDNIIILKVWKPESKGYRCVAKRPELDSHNEQHCYRDLIENDNDDPLCPCGNMPIWEPEEDA